MSGPARARVLHVIQNLNYGGMERLMVDLVRGIDTSRFEPHVLALEYLGRFSREMEGHAGLHLAPPMSRASLLRPAALAATVRHLAPSVVHTHSGVWYKAARAARMAGVPRLVHTEHGLAPDGWLGRQLDRRAARLTDVIVAVSRPLRSHLASRLALPEARIVVQANGVDLEEFRPRTPSGALWRELGLDAGRPIIGSIGRLEPVKGYDVVLSSFAEVLRRAPLAPPALVLVGDGSSRGDLEAQIQATGLTGHAFLLGWRDDAAELYPHFQTFVLGSWSEGTSVGLLEAMACGIPPVVTRVGGNPDVLGADLDSQMVAAGDVASLADRLLRTLAGETDADLGARARARVAAVYDVAATIRAYEGMYLPSR